MTEQTQQPTGHPMVTAIDAAHAAVDGVLELPEWSMDTTTTKASLTLLVALENKVAAAKLRALAHAETIGVAIEAGATSTANWFAHTTRTTRRDAHGQTRLAVALGHDRPVRRALWEGRLQVAQAQAITHAVDQLPETLDVAETEKVEAHLVDLAAHHDAKALRMLGLRAVEVIDPDLADAHEGQLLERQERAAQAATRLTMTDDGHGQVHGRFTLDTLHGAMLKKALLALLPRQDQHRPGPERMGQALTDYIERYPTKNLPHRGGVNATVVVTITLETLLGGLKAAHLDTGQKISASQARRLACEAGLIPAVLGGPSVVLDLGRKRRLFTEPQRIALALAQQSCAAEGCDNPPGMLHAHHTQQWSQGGNTDLANAVLICPYHHTRTHDPTYTTTNLPNGKITFHRRT